MPSRNTGPIRNPGKGRIVFAITHTTPGGLLELWQDLAAGLRARGHRVDLLALYPHDDTDGQPVHAPGWRYILPRRKRSPLAALTLIARTWLTLRRERPAVIISAMPFAGILLALLGRFIGPTPVVVTHHSPSFTYSPVLRRIDRQTGALANVRAIVGVSHAVVDSFRPASPAYEARLMTIRNAVPHTVERDLARLSADRLGRQTGRRLVALGRLVEQKNYPVLIRAMAHLPDVTLDIIGEGEDRAMLETMAHDLGVRDRIVFHGLRPRTETLRTAAAADVFVQPSLYEGHSLALIEAARLGLPIIVSNVPTQIEGVTASNGERCGLVVGADDDHALAVAVRRLLDDPAEYEVWAKAASRFGQDCRMDEVVARYETLVTRITAKTMSCARNWWLIPPETATINGESANRAKITGSREHNTSGV